MNNKLSNNLGKIIIGVAVVIITTSAFAKPLICKTSTTRQCSGGVCSDITITTCYRSL